MWPGHHLQYCDDHNHDHSDDEDDDDDDDYNLDNGKDIYKVSQKLKIFWRSKFHFWPNPGGDLLPNFPGNVNIFQPKVVVRNFKHTHFTMFCTAKRWKKSWVKSYWFSDWLFSSLSLIMNGWRNPCNFIIIPTVPIVHIPLWIFDTQAQVLQQSN